MKKILYLVLLSLSVAALAYGLEIDIVYSGSIDEKTAKAISADKVYDEEKLDKLVSSYLGENTTVLVYKDYKNYNSLEPLAVYIDGVRKSYNAQFSSSTIYPTIQDNIDNAYQTGGRTGAICRDGSRSSATGRGACSHHGGVARWLYAKIKDENAKIAFICKDYYLEAEGHNNCSKHQGILFQIKNRSY